jgi:Protein of unknown function (DUF1572)
VSEMNSAEAVVKEIANRMKDLLERAELAIKQLDDAQVWYRRDPTDNAIGNLVLHLVGNLRQWILGGLADHADTRDRPVEFSTQSGLSKAELMHMLRDTVEASCHTIRNLETERITEPRRIQDTDTTIAYAIVMAVSHLGVHVGQIQFITKSLLNDRYQVAWTPSPKK